jgi:hypothetical protein
MKTRMYGETVQHRRCVVVPFVLSPLLWKSQDNHRPNLAQATQFALSLVCYLIRPHQNDYDNQERRSQPQQEHNYNSTQGTAASNNRVFLGSERDSTNWQEEPTGSWFESVRLGITPTEDMVVAGCRLLVTSDDSVEQQPLIPILPRHPSTEGAHCDNGQNRHLQ